MFLKSPNIKVIKQQKENSKINKFSKNLHHWSVSMPNTTDSYSHNIANMNKEQTLGPKLEPDLYS